MKQVLLPILFICFLLLIGCNSEASEKVIQYQKNNEIIGEEATELFGEVSPTIYETMSRTNEETEEILVSPVERPGVSVTPPPGRYTIHPGEPGNIPQAGRVVIIDENELLVTEEIIGSYENVGSVTVTLNGTHSVYVDGFDYVYITPAPTEQSNELGAGVWEVGTDIAPGNYTVSASSDLEFGYLQIFEKGKQPRVFEILNNPTESTITVNLEEGQIIKITGVSYLQFD